ncbi:MAG: DUF3352 domain-containing protein, partial [Candidatus Peregrinibacteria bacterium]|nr:DUF3352 domain-containing protein [Candidatus Peregrinibacteria bacterium]
VFISSSSSAINEIFISEKKLESNEQYRKIRLDTPRKSFFFSYADSAQFVDLFLSGDRFATQKPLFDAGAKTLSSIGFSADVDDKSISVRSKILTADGVFSEHEIKKAANSVMPRLAQFSPKDALFFMNGIDLYAKYAHTKEFLAQFHPQFSVIFEGILRAWGRENFGDKFDFEKDFLAKMRGQYAVLVDFEDEAMPFLDFTLITGFGGVDIEKNLSDFHDAIHFAQSRFTTKVEEVELPDGTVREELVAVDESEIPINKIEFKGRDYFTVENSGSSNSKKLSYGFVENFLVFSTHENGLKSVLSAQATPENALSQNKDFRDSVLFRYSPSESYGFVNFAKLENAINLISNAEIGESGDFSITNLIRKNIRNATFARKVFPGEIFFSATLFAR